MRSGKFFIALAFAIHMLPFNVIAGGAEDYNNSRRERGAVVTEILEKNSVQLKKDQFLLFTFTKNVNSAALQKASTSANIDITSVYVCMPGGGVLAIYLDPKAPLLSQLNAGKRAETQITIDSIRATTQATGGAIFGGRTPDADLYCGVEIQGDWPSIRQFRNIFHSATYMVEINTSRVRKLPANLINP